MIYHKYRTGFTIIELMIVIAIIAVLASLMVANIRGNKVQESIVTLTNDVYFALSSQRTRALTTSRATYVIFNNRDEARALDLFIGNDSRCTPVQNALIGIHYSDEDIAGVTEQNVGIDLHIDAQKRTLNAASNNYYYEDNHPIVTFTSALSRLTLVNDNSVREEENVNVNGTLSVCFQPNGQIEFFVDGALENANSATITVGSINGCRDSGGHSEIVVDRFGSLQSDFIADCMPGD